MQDKSKPVRYVLAGVLLTLLAVVVLALAFIQPIDRYLHYHTGLESILDMHLPELYSRQVTKIECSYAYIDGTLGHTVVTTETTDPETIRRVVELWNKTSDRRPVWIGNWNDYNSLDKKMTIRFFREEQELLCVEAAELVHLFSGDVNGPWEIEVRDASHLLIVCWKSSQETFRELADLLGADKLY